ncbi:hypothetical protein [Celerinatantimonas diazotrophica]|uniref:Uncharacterized protein n=1 Tax=Celerinatantimonas diazotrophica TaxID=412034 RepID=A0A4R1K1X6_9GAMM|nr:hypothetical protein [Celerinatantimonas diazotrophica]TCK58004.1 hypothetical protein EV690_1709 [Celerinatantimonas diazotrophica]CAG9297927.1 hypothetical protein CEDIAZO_03119 [Celerinatantimonas diazotrophica]
MVELVRESQRLIEWYASHRQNQSYITMSYQQLTEGQRYQISALLAEGDS